MNKQLIGMFQLEDMFLTKQEGIRCGNQAAHVESPHGLSK